MGDIFILGLGGHYHFGATGTWYQGDWDFLSKSSDGRLYPDEYLIVDILEKYMRQHPNRHDKEKIVFIKEPWVKNSGIRDGRTNVAIGQQIMKFIETQCAENPNPDRLIVAPFLLYNHHPGIAIDLKNKVAIYIDPFGSPSYDIEDLQELKCKLVSLGFEFQEINTAQQVRAKDTSSCGPILTDSLMTLMDAFLAKGCITGVVFRAAKQGLATSRLVQMNLRNPKLEAKEEEATVDEISLADVNLWKSFFTEQQCDKEQYVASIIHAIEKQKASLKRVLSDQNKHTRDLAFIITFQSQVTKLIRHKPQDAQASILSLIQRNDTHFSTSELDVPVANPSITENLIVPTKRPSESNLRGHCLKVFCDWFLSALVSAFIGALIGLAIGAMVGGSVGTSTIPLLGTFVGAVGGALAGAAVGATLGGIVGTAAFVCGYRNFGTRGGCFFKNAEDDPTSALSTELDSAVFNA